MNIWKRTRSPTRKFIVRRHEELRWVWDPQPGRTFIVGERNPLRRLLYKVAIFLGWRPIIPFAGEAPTPDDTDDGLLGTGVPRRPPDSSGAVSAAVAPPGSEDVDRP